VRVCREVRDRWLALLFLLLLPLPRLLGDRVCRPVWLLAWRPVC
jgi:hypothetical protein